jgi:hypothetical protein
MNHRATGALAALAPLFIAATAMAQTIPNWETKQFAMERIDECRVRLMREVEVIGTGPNKGQQIFADDLLWNTCNGELSAEGNALLVSPTSRIAAERVAFNTKTGLGTFYTASGMAGLGDRAEQDKSMFGGLEPDVYFYGESIEKIGEDRYRINKGGFTTCVQPTPRWDVVSRSATINLEDYAILRNAVLRVKDVPVFYLPILYYPIQSDDRATGFLMPSYGNSTYQGQSISNAFFWAIDRSQDLTAFHDWFFSRGQGMGSEYRYVSSPTSQGQLRTYWLFQNEATFDSNGSSIAQPEQRSYEINGSMTQSLPAGMQARARVNYFSNLGVHQTYNYDFNRAVDGSRRFGGTLTGSWSGVTVNANYERSELLQSADTFSVNGQLPSLRADLSSRQLGSMPLFLAVQSEYSRGYNRFVLFGTEQSEYTVTRRDLTPTLRSTLSNLSFFRLNGIATFPYTHYSGSLNQAGQFVEDPLTRRYAELRAEATGPVLTRVFSPQAGWADRAKHVIEPIATVQYRTDTPPISSIAPTGSTAEYIVGDTTTISYGVVNRLLVKPQPGPKGEAVPSRELLTVTVQQSYYSNPLASQFDPTYGLTYFNRPPNNYSPIALVMRSMPTTFTTADFRMEYDTTAETGKLQGITVGGGVNMPLTQANVSWNKRRFGANLVDASNNFISGAFTTKTRGGQLGGTFSFNYDFGRDNLVQQRWIAFYNAQCCGVTMEYQTFSFPGGDPRFPVPQDRRFNFSFSLAGVGSFSNFFGVFGLGGGSTGSRY